MQNKDYRNTFGISQSAIKSFRFKSPKQWKKVWIDQEKDIDKSEDSFIFGSLVDTMLFTPEELEERFYVANTNLPSKAVENIIRAAHEMHLKKIQEFKEIESDLPVNFSPEKDIPFEDFLLICADNYSEEEGKKGWQNNWKPETRLTKLKELGGPYLKLLIDAGIRKIITTEMNFDAIGIRDLLYNDETVKRYFICDEDSELVFQLEIFQDYILENGKTIPIKCAIDILRIDHKNKTVQIIDFKTTRSAYDFVKSIKQFGYCTQLSFYDYILRVWMQEECNTRFCDYHILPPINIAIDKADKVPYIYEYDWRDLAFEREGNSKYLYDLFKTSEHNSKIKKGWEEILQEIGWHYHTDLWDKPREMYENNKIRINLLNN